MDNKKIVKILAVIFILWCGYKLIICWPVYEDKYEQIASYGELSARTEFNESVAVPAQELIESALSDYSYALHHAGRNRTSDIVGYRIFGTYVSTEGDAIVELYADCGTEAQSSTGSYDTDYGYRYVFRNFSVGNVVYSMDGLYKIPETDKSDNMQNEISSYLKCLEEDILLKIK